MLRLSQPLKRIANFAARKAHSSAKEADRPLYEAAVEWAKKNPLTATGYAYLIQIISCYIIKL